MEESPLTTSVGSPVRWDEKHPRGHHHRRFRARVRCVRGLRGIIPTFGRRFRIAWEDAKSMYVAARSGGLGSASRRAHHGAHACAGDDAKKDSRSLKRSPSVQHLPMVARAPNLGPAGSSPLGRSLEALGRPRSGASGRRLRWSTGCLPFRAKLVDLFPGQRAAEKRSPPPLGQRSPVCRPLRHLDSPRARRTARGVGWLALGRRQRPTIQRRSPT